MNTSILPDSNQLAVHTRNPVKVIDSFEDLKVNVMVIPQGEDSFLVGTKATSGLILRVIYNVYKDFISKKGVIVKMKSGRTLTKNDALRILDSRPNGLVFKFEAPDGAKEALESAIERSTGKIEREEKFAAKYKADAPKRKAAVSKIASAERKADLARYDAKYGKGTWNRVTYKQEGGDDGYQYVVRVDGRAFLNGLTRSSAIHEKECQVIAIAKKEKLGNYA